MQDNGQDEEKTDNGVTDISDAICAGGEPCPWLAGDGGCLMDVLEEGVDYSDKDLLSKLPKCSKRPGHGSVSMLVIRLDPDGRLQIAPMRIDDGQFDALTRAIDEGIGKMHFGEYDLLKQQFVICYHGESQTWMMSPVPLDEGQKK